MINLLPPKRLQDMRYAWSNTVLRRYIFLIVISSLVIAGIIGGAYVLFLRQKESARLAVEADSQRIKKYEPVQKNAEQLSGTINAISTLMSKDVRFSQMLTQIANLMPPGSSLTGLQIDIEDTKAPLAISADVDTESKAAVLRNNLAQSELFEGAEIKSIKSIKAEASPEPAQASTYKFTTTIDVIRKGQSSGDKK